MSFRIEDICEINSESISKNDRYTFINYLDTGNLTEGVIEEIKRLEIGIDKIPSRAKRKVRKGDILISTVRPNQKHYGMVSGEIENLIVSTGFAVIRAGNKVDATYLYKYLTLPNIVEYLQSVAETSTTAYPSIKPSVIGDIEIQLPSLEEQKAIANILSSLDEKIELNSKMNKTLEEMAQALFTRWFVDFEFPNENGEPYKSSGGKMVDSELGMIPKGWMSTNIDKVVTSANTGADAIRRAPIVEYDTGIKCARVGDLSNQRGIAGWGYCEISEVDYEKFKLCKGDILVTRTGTIGLSTFINEDISGVFNNGLIRLRIIKEIPPLFIYQLINQSDYYNHISKITGETSTRPNMKINYLLGYKFVLPPKEIIEKFIYILDPIHLKINENEKEITTLILLRDTLLPKLMSGEIRVTDLQN